MCSNILNFNRNDHTISFKVVIEYETCIFYRLLNVLLKIAFVGNIAAIQMVYLRNSFRKTTFFSREPDDETDIL